MKRLTYWLALVVVYPLSLLPFAILYLVSDFIFVLVYYVFRYRRSVVDTNLLHAFPAMNDIERKEVAKRFYGNFCDIIVENIKFITISPAEVKKRLLVINSEPLNAYFDKGQSVLTTLGHCGNWEMAGLAASYELKHHSIAIYRPLSNPYFDKLVTNIRARFGLELVAHTKTRQILSQLHKSTNVYHFITDQVPTKVETAYWTKFLNQDTPIYMGAEKVAKMTNMPVFFLKILRTKRGYYSLEMQLVATYPSKCADYEITEKHTKLLEENIQAQPDNWLWSHRRWKHKRPASPVTRPAA